MPKNKKPKGKKKSTGMRASAGGNRTTISKESACRRKD
jgi:hypothetical protein